MNDTSKQKQGPITYVLATRAILVKPSGEVLLVRRSQTDTSRQGVWEFPGGHVDEGESLEVSALRETQEETGLSPKELKFYYTSSYKVAGQHRLSGTFIGQVPVDAQVVLSHEHDEYKWVNSSNFHIKDIDPYYEKVLQRWFGTDTEEESEKTNDEKQTTNKKASDAPIQHMIAYTDGGSRGNPGPSASGYVLMNQDKEVIEEGGEYLGITTNNQAEYQAVKLALEKARRFNPSSIDFFIDSLLVVNQMSGKFKVKNKDLWPIHEAIKDLSSKFDKVTFTHVRREYNTLADDEVNKVLDSYEHREKSAGREGQGGGAGGSAMGRPGDQAMLDLDS